MQGLESLSCADHPRHTKNLHCRTAQQTARQGRQWGSQALRTPEKRSASCCPTSSSWPWPWQHPHQCTVVPASAASTSMCCCTGEGEGGGCVHCCGMDSLIVRARSCATLRHARPPTHALHAGRPSSPPGAPAWRSPSYLRTEPASQRWSAPRLMKAAAAAAVAATWAAATAPAAAAAAGAAAGA